MDNQSYVAIIVFLLTYAIIVSEKIHRTIIAMAGAGVMVLIGIVDQEKAIEHIDFNTIGLLVGMMILVNITAQTGVFKYMAIKAAKMGKGDPIRLLVALSTITAIGSAFLDNVTTVLLIVPVTLSITRQLKLPPVPYLISEILFSNIGGTATLIGDPPNIMIGSANKELDFMAFIFNLTPIIAIIFPITLIILVFLYRKQLKTTPELKANLMSLNEKDEITDRTLLIKSLVSVGLTIFGFTIHSVLGLESATIAMAGAFLLLLLTGEHYLEAALARVEWTTIFFFVGLFILVSGLVETGVIRKLAEDAISLTGGNVAFTSVLILWISAIASAFIDNIPFVATMIPLIQDMGSMGIHNLDPIWWSLALGACLGGNGTIIGASANVVVIGMAAKENYKITFVHFLKIAFPLMILSIILSNIYVWIRYL